MLSSMMASSRMDAKNWPALGAEDSSQQQGNDWELLDPTEEDGSDTHHAKVVVVGTDSVRRRQLRHCASSPNLHQYDFLDAVDEEEVGSDGHGEHPHQKDDDSSYAMVSGPRSVITVSSGFSFRDAILSPSKKEEQQQESSTCGVQTQPRRAYKPKFVVKPIRRCSKSTGDLQSLTKIVEDDEILGETDAMDFYHRKAVGARNRTSGLKMRPDELKRKEITLFKKALQQGKSR